MERSQPVEARGGSIRTDETSRDRVPAGASTEWLADGGQMGTLIRAYDWSTTPLGPMETWPQSLRTAASIVLASGFPMLVLWGRDYIQLYNDAFRPILGTTKHPAALGQRAHDCWSEIWDVLDPLFRGVMDGGDAVWNEDLQFVLDRNGYLEETFFTFSYSAIRDESGRPGGILVTCVETTERVIGERRLRTLRELAARASTTHSVDETCATAARSLSTNPHDVPFAMLYLSSGANLTLRATTGIERGTTASPEVVAWGEADAAWPLRHVMADAASQLVTDLPARMGDLPGGPWPDVSTAALVLPITPATPGKASGALVAGISPRRALDAGYRSFLELVASQISTAIALREDEERYRRLAALLPVAVYTCEAPSGVITFYNQLAAQLWGRAPRLGDLDERFCGSFRLWQSDGTLLPHDETPMALALREGRSFRNQEVVIERPDGSRISALVNIDPIVDPDGQVVGAINVFHDTTELRSAREKLRHSEEHLRAIVDTTPACINVVAADGTILHMNAAGLAMVDASQPEEVEGTSMFALIRAEHRPAFRAFHERICRGEKGALEFDLVGPRGTCRHVETHAAPLRAPDGRVLQLAITFDVTERKAAEAAARRAVDHLQIVTDAMAVPVTRCTPDLRYAWVSRPYAEWIGQPAEHIIGRPLVEVIGEEAFEQLSPMFQRVLGGEVVRFEEQVTVRGIGRRWINAVYTPTEDASGTCDGWVSVVLDVTERKRTEEAHRRLAAIVESSDDAILSMDMEGKVTSWNRGAERLYGYTTGDMVGKPISVLIPHDHVDDFPAIMQRIRRGEGIDHHETVRIAKGGRRIDVSLTTSPIRDARGRVIGVSKSARDISERKRTEAVLQKHTERTQLLWEAAGVLLTTDEPHAMLQRLFAKIEASFGLDVYLNYMVMEGGEELRLVSCAGIDQDVAAGISRLAFGQAICGTVALRRAPIVATRIQDSHEPMVQIVKGLGVRTYACTPLLAGQRLLGTLSFASRTRDDFDQDEVEFLQTISHYVASAYERLRLIEQLREEDRRKDEFLAMLAHELRNPLAPIRTGVQLIQRAGQNTALMEKACAIMERQLQHMVRLVDDLLDVSRVTRNKLELRKEWVDLATIVQSALETSRPLIEAFGHELTVSLPAEPVVLAADGVRLAQAFANLLNNAAKYTERGGRIQVTANAPSDGEGSASEVVVRVRDTGIGIPADELPSIFDMFVQVERSSERLQGGLGIGLTLAQRLIQMHGGTLSAFSDGPGKGSEFVVRLPVVVLPDAPALHDARQRGGTGRPRLRRRILVVDDNRDSADLLATTLRLLGHDVETAHDGLEAIEKVRTLHPDVAFMDLGMPRMNGYEAARRIRERAGAGMTLVAVTGWGHPDDKRRSRDAGFDAHVVKPVDLAALEELLDRIPATGPPNHGKIARVPS